MTAYQALPKKFDGENNYINVVEERFVSVWSQFSDVLEEMRNLAECVKDNLVRSSANEAAISELDGRVRSLQRGIAFWETATWITMTILVSYVITTGCNSRQKGI